MSKKLKVCNSIMLDNNINLANLNELSHEILLKKLDELNNNEPPRILKNKHKRW